jgi:hypothetical protein
MRCDHAQAPLGSLSPPVQLEGEQQVGQLRRAVRGDRVVSPVLEVQISDVQATAPVRKARYRDYPGTR